LTTLDSGLVFLLDLTSTLSPDMIASRKPRLFALATLLLALVVTSGFAYHVAQSFQYRAVKVDSDRDIDDRFNELAAEGWYPRFVMKYEADPRLIFERDRDEAYRVTDLEYRADVVRSAKEIDDTFNERSGDG